MREIKFRGTDNNGIVIYGNYHQYSRSECAIGDGKRLAFIKPESVAQLVGHDKHGKEVYEGDTLLDEFGNEICAGFVTIPIELMTLKESKNGNGKS